MLYNKSAVKNRVPVTKKQIELARKSPLFNLNKKAFGYVLERISIDIQDVYHVMNGIRKEVYREIRYDCSHEFRGIRTASQVLEDRKGHCIEQGILFYAIAKKLKIPVKPVIVKNPKGYEGSWSIKNLGIHTFLLFNYRGDEYIADFLHIRKFPESGFCVGKQKLSGREFTAFCFQDGGEDFAIHADYELASSSFRTALSIDPNNYTIYVSAADAASNRDDIENADKLYKRAIRIAPDIADTHWAYADFFSRTYRPDKARKIYLMAAKRETKDIQILNDLEKKLAELGEWRVSEKMRRKRLSILESGNMKSYFS